MESDMEQGECVGTLCRCSPTPDDKEGVSSAPSTAEKIETIEEDEIKNAEITERKETLQEIQTVKIENDDGGDDDKDIELIKNCQEHHHEPQPTKKEADDEMLLDIEADDNGNAAELRVGANNNNNNPHHLEHKQGLDRLGLHLLADEPAPVRVTNFFIDDILKPDFGRGKTAQKSESLHRVSIEDDGQCYSDSEAPSPGSCCSARLQGDGEVRSGGRAASQCYSSRRDSQCRSDSPTSPSEPIVWPAWVYCTRYSDRPSSGPRSRKIRRKDRKPDEKRPRTAFTNEQLKRLKDEFEENRYLTEERRQKLAKDLGLNESQIKIWFQNKRAKMKKSSGVRNALALQLMAQGLYNHASMPSGVTDGDLSHS